MKKSLLIVVLICMVVLPASAQLRFGVKGGVDLSYVHIETKRLNHTNNPLLGYNVGPMMEYMSANEDSGIDIGLDLAVQYASKGLRYNKENLRTGYINIPINYKMKFAMDENAKFTVAVGPYFGIAVDKSNKLLDTLTSGGTTSAAAELVPEGFDYGFNFGVGTEFFNHIQVGLTYTLGTSRAYKVNLANTSKGKNYLYGYNRGLSLSLAYLF